MSCEACTTEETPPLFCLGRCPRASPAQMRVLR
jgi:hypothetical protein